MDQNSSAKDKLKNILEALGTDIAKEILQELNQIRPQGEKSSVKKEQLYKLITELSNISNLEQLKNEIREKENIIKLQENYMANQKAYAINLETNQKQQIDLLLTSIQQNSIENLKNIQNNQNNQELTQINKLQEEFLEQQKQLFEITIKQQNQMEIQATKTLDDREFQEKIFQLTESVISKSQKFLDAAIYFSKQNEFNILEQDIQDQIVTSIKIIQSCQNILKKLKNICSDQIQQLNNYANNSLLLIKQIQQKNEEIKNFQVQQKKYKEDHDRMQQNLLKQADAQTRQFFEKNQQVFEHITQKFFKFSDGLKSQLYKFNQDIIKGIIEEQTYFLTKDLQTIKQSIQLGDTQKLLKQKVPANITELLQQIAEMRKLQILQPAQVQLISFENFAKNLEDQINKFLI